MSKEGEAGAKRRSLLLLLDGVRPDAFLAADAPNLKALALAGGAFSFHVDVGGVPLSAPAWATILTGVAPSGHPVTTNDLGLLSFDVEGRLQAAPVRCACTPDRRPLCQAYSRGQQLRGELVPLPPTVFARLARAGRSAALVLAGKWDGVGRLCGTRAGDVETAIEGGAVKFRHFDARDASADAMLDCTRAALGHVGELLGTAGPDVVALYVDAIDTAGHTEGFGPEVPAYMRSIADVDALLAPVLAAIRGDAAAWQVLVTTDHGGTARRRMPPEMWRAFGDCACVQQGIAQTGLQGVHGLRELPQHTQTFFIVSGGEGLDVGEMLPAPRPEDVAPTLLRHILGEEPSAEQEAEPARGRARGYAAAPPPPAPLVARAARARDGGGEGGQLPKRPRT